MFDALNSISEGYLCIGLDEAELQKRMPVNGDLSGLSLGEHIFNSLLKYLWLVSSTLTQFGGFLSLI